MRMLKMTVMTMVLATDTSGKNPSADLPPQDLYVERVAVARRFAIGLSCQCKVSLDIGPKTENSMPETQTVQCSASSVHCYYPWICQQGCYEVLSSSYIWLCKAGLGLRVQVMFTPFPLLKDVCADCCVFRISVSCLPLTVVSKSRWEHGH